MKPMQPMRDIGLGRTLVGVVALVAALAYGSIAAASAGGTDLAGTTGLGCRASAVAATDSAPSGVEWSSSRGMPGKPY